MADQAEVTSEDRVRRIVIEHLGVESEKITSDASFMDDLGCDSLDTIELVMAFEEEFNVEIADAEMEECETFGKAVSMIESKLGNGAA